MITTIISLVISFSLFYPRANTKALSRFFVKLFDLIQSKKSEKHAKKQCKIRHKFTYIHQISFLRFFYFVFTATHNLFALIISIKAHRQTKSKSKTSDKSFHNSLLYSFSISLILINIAELKTMTKIHAMTNIPIPIITRIGFVCV